jgi:DNA-binding response OmpR family regulator
LRLLIVDSNSLLARVLRHELPEADLLTVRDFAAAAASVRAEPPDVAVVSLPPADVPWRAFQRLCASQRPAVPVLYESCLYASAEAAGLGPEDGRAAFLPKPAERGELRRALESLLATVEATPT